MKITNNHKTAIGLPDGTVLQPGEPTEVENWDQVQKNAVVQGWIKAEILTAAAGGNPGGEGGVDKDALIARAKELGIDAKGTWGVPKLEAAIAEAEAKATANGNPGGEG